MEPALALTSLEAALRQAVVAVLGEHDWINAKGAPDKAKLEKNREEETKKRDGTILSQNLIEYTETYHLTEIIIKNWEKFKPVFDDKQRTSAYLGVLKDIRNTIAHSRELVPYERDLMSGITGHLRNQVGKYRSSVMQSSDHYPVIESVRDSFGRLGGESYYADSADVIRVEVGDTVQFTGTAAPARGKEVLWILSTDYMEETSLRDTPIEQKRDLIKGESATLSYTFKEGDVGEWMVVKILIGGQSRFHRNFGFDDSTEFVFAVNPPEE
ncbi:Swt1 family HEPN domain-containing protein [Kocuria sp. CPCC 205268]|uniref:Swt1 family HEPN domain-containing protein n=1 Tax=Kocuria oxytropis TaxID=3058913 RepID=UPI0034D3C736